MKLLVNDHFRIFNFLSLVRSSGVDASAQTATRNILRQTLVNVNFANLPFKSSSTAFAYIISDQVCAASIVLARHRVALVDVELAIFSLVSRLAITDWRCCVCHADSFVFAAIDDAISEIAKGALKTFATYACEVVASC